MLRYGSRKFLVCLAVLGSSSWLVFEKVISSGDYKAIVIGVIVAYLTSNVAQKATAKNDQSSQ